MAAYKHAMAQRALPTTVFVQASQLSSGAQNQQQQQVQQMQHYLEFDEKVLQRMAQLGWNRAHGVAKLTPLACALYEHWKLEPSSKI